MLIRPILPARACSPASSSWRRPSVQVQACPAGLVVAGVFSGSMTLVTNTCTDPDLMSAGGVVALGFHDSDLMPEQRQLVTARMQTDCPSVTAADIGTGLGMMLQIGDPNLGTNYGGIGGPIPLVGYFGERTPGLCGSNSQLVSNSCCGEALCTRSIT